MVGIVDEMPEKQIHISVESGVGSHVDVTRLLVLITGEADGLRGIENILFHPAAHLAELFERRGLGLNLHASGVMAYLEPPAVLEPHLVLGAAGANAPP